MEPTIQVSGFRVLLGALGVGVWTEHLQRNYGVGLSGVREAPRRLFQ